MDDARHRLLRFSAGVVRLGYGRVFGGGVDGRSPPRDAEKRGGTVSIDMADSHEVCRELLKRDVLVDWRPKAGVRMSPHFYNTDEEIDKAVATVNEILHERVPTAR